MGKQYCYLYPHPAVTTDCVIFGFKERLHILLIRRKQEPFIHQWAFPGGFLNPDENLEECARRELLEETHLALDSLHEFGSFSTVDRDPRERVISIAYWGLVSLPQPSLKAGDDAEKFEWFALDAIPDLAFDHHKMLFAALRHLQQTLRYKSWYPEEASSIELYPQSTEILKQVSDFLS